MTNKLIVIHCALENQSKVVFDDTYHTGNLETIFRDFNSLDCSDREMSTKLGIRSLSVNDLVC